MTNLEHYIRERAYHLWLANGCRDGEAQQHWLVAEREVLAGAMASATAPEKPAAKTAKRVAAKPKAKRRAA